PTTGQVRTEAPSGGGPEAATTAVIATAGRSPSSTSRLDTPSGSPSLPESLAEVPPPTPALVRPRWRPAAVAAALTGLLAAGAIATAIVSAPQREVPAVRPTRPPATSA